MMDKHHRQWTDRLSGYLAGDVDVHERVRIDAHLAECAECREVLSGLERVVTLAREVADVEPPRDLWPGIEAALAGAGPEKGDDHVIALPTAHVRPVGPGRRIGPGRLAAAAVLLVAATATATWRLASSTSESPSGDVALLSGGADGARGVAASVAPQDLADQLAELQQVYDSARESLDPNTVLVLERNLTAIERAIADSRSALAHDPGNAFLSEHLERMYERKMSYLQDVVRVVQWAG